MTPFGQRKIGTVFVALGPRQLISTLFTGRTEGLDGLVNMDTGQSGVPPPFANKPVVFLSGLALYASLMSYEFKLFRESRRADR